MAATGLDIRYGRESEHRPKNFKRTPETYTIRECARSEWGKLSRYHYLTGHLKTTAKTYGLYNPQNRLIGICATIIMPRNNGTAMMRIHRIVIHPDYQGIGLGKRFVTIIGKLESKNHDVFIQTSNPAMKHALLHYSGWVLSRNGMTPNSRSNRMLATRRIGKTATFVMRKEQ